MTFPRRMPRTPVEQQLTVEKRLNRGAFSGRSERIAPVVRGRPTPPLVGGGAAVPPIQAEQPDEPADLRVHWLWFDTDDPGELPTGASATYYPEAVATASGTWSAASGVNQDVSTGWTNTDTPQLAFDGFGAFAAAAQGAYSGIVVVSVSGLAAGEVVRLNAFSDAIGSALELTAAAGGDGVARLVVAVPTHQLSATQMLGFISMVAWFAGSAPTYSVAVYATRVT